MSENETLVVFATVLFSRSRDPSPSQRRSESIAMVRTTRRVATKRERTITTTMEHPSLRRRRLFTRSRGRRTTGRCGGSVRKALGFARRDDVAWTPHLPRGGCATPMTTMETRVDDSLSSDVRACVRRRASVRWVDGRMCTTASSSAHR